MDTLTHTLDQMIYHQRQADSSLDSGLADYHHREALRYREAAKRLESRAKVGRWLCDYSYLSLN